MRYLTILALCLFTLIGKAQQEEASPLTIEQGQVWISGAFSFFNSTGEDTGGADPSESSNSSLIFSPKLGYVVSDKLEVGVLADFRTRDSEFSRSATNSESRDQEISFGAYAEPNIFFGKRLAFVPGVSVLVRQDKEESEFTGSALRENEFNSFTARVAPKFSYYTDSKLRVSMNVMNLQYTTSTRDSDVGSATERNRDDNSIRFSVFENSRVAFSWRLTK